MAVKISESALPETAHAPCTACSWSAERQQRSLYNSHVKLFYSMGDRGAWSLGNRIILKERDFAESNNEIVNCRFLSQSTTLPVPEIIEHWNEVGRSFILSRRVPGQTLEAAWPSLSPDDRERIAIQTAAYLKQLRLIQSSRMQCLEGKPIYSALLFRDHMLPHGPFATDEEFWQDFEQQLHHLPQRAQDKIRERLPPCQPYTFTHNDLAMVNIIVHDGNLAAIIDWEVSGFFPVWWEYALCQIGHSPEDKAWKDLLRKYMQPHEEAAQLYKDLFKLGRAEAYPEEAAAILEGLMKYSDLRGADEVGCRWEEQSFACQDSGSRQ